MALDETIVQAVGNSNFKSAAEMGILNALASQQRVQVIAEKGLGKTIESMDVNSVSEGLGPAGAAVAGYGQMIKGLVVTPPVDTGT
jgi:hypothetical protein